jgi:putative ABC transport system substrate-binding protein
VSANIKRREFITLLCGTAVAWPLAARAQQIDRMRRIGALIAFAKDDSETEERLAGFRQGLAKRGWVEGRNIHMDYRFAAGRGDQFPVLAKELVAMQPDVILAHTPGATIALQRETRTIPIVFVNVSDPIGMGFIASLPRPGGNLTGVLHYEATIVGKWLAMLREIAPRLTRAALLANPKVTSTILDSIYARARVNVNLELSRSGNGVKNGFRRPAVRGIRSRHALCGAQPG